MRTDQTEVNYTKQFITLPVSSHLSVVRCDVAITVNATLSHAPNIMSELM